MMKMIKSRLILFLAICLMTALTAGCIPYSDNPITEPGVGRMDSSIYGTWFWKEENESSYVHIGLDEKTGLLRVVMLDFNKDQSLDVSEFSGHTSLLGENRYLNLKWVSPPGNVPGYMFVKYRTSGNTLGIALMDNDEVEKAVKDGRLSGRLGEEKWSSSVHITAEREKLQRFISDHDSKLFKEMNNLRKLNLPD